MITWVNVKDKKPLDTDVYLCIVLFPDSIGGSFKLRVMDLLYNESNQSWSVESGIVTHWTNLPDIPEDIVLR